MWFSCSPLCCRPAIPGGAVIRRYRHLVQCGRHGHCWHAAGLAHGAVQVAPLGEALEQPVAVGWLDEVGDDGHGWSAECLSGQSSVRFARCPETGFSLFRDGTAPVPKRDAYMASDLQSLDIT
jgi:hypothetical protein